MSVGQYSSEVIVVAVADGPSDLKVWLRDEAPAGLAGDLRWSVRKTRTLTLSWILRIWDIWRPQVMGSC